MSNETVDQELRNTIEQCTKWAQRNYVYAHVVFILSVLGSFAAAELAAAEQHNAALASALAALPDMRQGTAVSLFMLNYRTPDFINVR